MRPLRTVRRHGRKDRAPDGARDPQSAGELATRSRTL
jgi:hypothetical protein